MPNITGSARISDVVSAGSYCHITNTSGALYAGSNFNAAYVGGSVGTYSQANNLQFDASRSNGLYGDSNTVQPPAISLIPQIKF